LTQHSDSHRDRARPRPPKGEDRRRSPTVAIVLEPDLRGPAARSAAARAADRLLEAEGLARAIDLEIAHSAIVPVAKPQPATLFGSGKVEEIAGIVTASEADSSSSTTR
jgi:GTP-binding protein HflX